MNNLRRYLAISKKVFENVLASKSPEQYSIKTVIGNTSADMDSLVGTCLFAYLMFVSQIQTVDPVFEDAPAQRVERHLLSMIDSLPKEISQDLGELRSSLFDEHLLSELEAIEGFEGVEGLADGVRETVCSDGQLRAGATRP